MLADLLVETVASGGSVSFMHPLAPAAAEAFWHGALAAAERGERIVFGAWDGAALVGTVTLLLDLPPNQPHRAEIAKMMTRVSHRGRGLATALLRWRRGGACWFWTPPRRRARPGSTSGRASCLRERFPTTRSSRMAA
jgi:GNAT superfamily N-acetyltransferase